MLAVCVLTREFMAQLKERKVDEGHIVIINRYRIARYHIVFRHAKGGFTWGPTRPGPSLRDEDN